MIRATIRHKWRGNWYDKGDVIPANSRQATRIVDAGLAYIDNVDMPAKDKLEDAGYNDIKSIQKASDDELLNIEGVGPATLTKIRTFTADHVEGCGCQE